MTSHACHMTSHACHMTIKHLNTSSTTCMYFHSYTDKCCCLPHVHSCNRSYRLIGVCDRQCSHSAFHTWTRSTKATLNQQVYTKGATPLSAHPPPPPHLTHHGSSSPSSSSFMNDFRHSYTSMGFSCSVLVLCTLSCSLGCSHHTSTYKQKGDAQAQVTHSHYHAHSTSHPTHHLFHLSPLPTPNFKLPSLPTSHPTSPHPNFKLPPHPTPHPTPHPL